MQETQETWVPSLDWEDPCRRKWQPAPVFLLGKFHGQRSLTSYSPWVGVGKESDMTEATEHMYTCLYFTKTLHFPNFLGSRCSYVRKFWPVRLRAQVCAFQETSSPSSLHPWSLSSSFLPFLCSDPEHWQPLGPQRQGSHPR